MTAENDLNARKFLAALLGVLNKVQKGIGATEIHDPAKRCDACTIYCNGC